MRINGEGWRMVHSSRARRRRLLEASGCRWPFVMMRKVRSRSSPVPRCRQIYGTDSCTQFFPRLRWSYRHRDWVYESFFPKRMQRVVPGPTPISQLEVQVGLWSDRRHEFGGQSVKDVSRDVVHHITISIAS